MKQLTFCLMSAALLFASCSNNETDGWDTFNPNVINFTNTTTRATINDLASLESSDKGFVVYAKSGSNPSTWYTGVDGTNNYKYTSSSWGWANTITTPSWPTTTEGYPMKFYAFYPDPSTNTDFTLSVNSVSSIKAEITIQADAAEQVDYLAATSTAISRPGDGNLPLTFKHILSKVNMGIIAGKDASVYVQSAKIVNISSRNTYDYITGLWGTASISTSFSYFNNPTNPFTPMTKDETTANPFYTENTTPKAANSHLMLMPQITTPWTPAKGVAASDSYIEVVYRIEITGDDNSVGYKDATKHPDYSTKGNDITGPLFVKVGFPLDATWEMGKGYTYNICLGTVNSSGGNYTEDTYIDENGGKTNLPIDDDKQKGDPVQKGEIGFKLSVTPWTDTDASEIK